MIKFDYKTFFIKRNIRIIGWTLVTIFFVTFCMPVFFFYYLFDKNNVNHLITSQINSANYVVEINGDIEPRSWHGLSLYIADISIYDRNHIKIMHINAVNGQLSWLDLIIGQYKIRRIAFNGLTMYSGNIDKKSYSELINYNGIRNSELSKLKNISVSNFTVINSEGENVLRDVNINATNINTITPHLSVHFAIPNSNTVFSLQGDFDRGNTDEILELSKLNVDLSSNKYKLNLHSGGHYDIHNQEIWFDGAKGNISLYNYNGTVSFDSALLSIYGLTINQFQAQFRNSNYGSNFVINADNLSSSDFNDVIIKNLVINHDLQSSVLGTNINLKVQNAVIESGAFFNSKKCLMAYTVLAKQNGVTSSGTMNGSCSIDNDKHYAAVNLSGVFDQNKADFKAMVNYRESIPVINLSGNFEKIDFDKFINKGNNSSSLYNDDSLLPFSWIGSFKGNINIASKNVKLMHADLSNVSAKAEVGKTFFNINNLTANIYSGSITGNMNVLKNESNNYNIAFNQKITNVNLQKVFISLFDVSAISGTANVNLNSYSNNVKLYRDIYQKINGNIQLMVSNGGFGGIDFDLLLNPANIDIFNTKNKLQTKFTSLRANFGFQNGVSQKGGILFSSPMISANGSGVVDFSSNKINYNLNVKSVVPHNIHNVNSVSIPTSVNGSLFSPKIYIKNMTLNSSTNVNNSGRQVKKRTDHK